MPFNYRHKHSFVCQMNIEYSYHKCTGLQISDFSAARHKGVTPPPPLPCQMDTFEVNYASQCPRCKSCISQGQAMQS